MDWGILVGAIGIAIAMLALIVAVPPFVQMIWGAPNLEIGFAAADQGDTRVLICQIKNRPVASRALRKIGVTRGIIDVEAFFEIAPSASPDTPILEGCSAVISTGHGRRARRASLIPGLTVAFNILTHIKGTAISGDTGKNGTVMTLKPGLYIANIIVVTGDKHFTADREFIVGRTQQETAWG